MEYRNQQAAQYPEYAGKIRKYCQRMNGSGTCSGCKWQGKQCYDCAQLVRWGMKEAGINLPSGATSQWKSSLWEDKGTIDTLPKDKVCAVYRATSNTVMGHTGIYLGDGTVVDARGHEYGVKHETVDAYGKWTHWAMPKGLYEKTEDETGEMGMTGIVTGGNLNLRSSASKAASCIASMPDGTMITILQRGDEWSKVQYGTKTGYAMSKYITFTEEQAADEEGYDIVIRCQSKEERDVMLT